MIKDDVLKEIQNFGAAMEMDVSVLSSHVAALFDGSDIDDQIKAATGRYDFAEVARLHNFKNDRAA